MHANFHLPTYDSSMHLSAFGIRDYRNSVPFIPVS